MEIGTIDFEVWEDGNVFVGLASVQLPNKSQKSIVINGAAIGGDVEVPVRGHYDAMEMPLVFRSYSERVAKLREPRVHQIDLRIAQQNEDPKTGTMKVVAVKHLMRVVPKSQSGGSIAPASSSDTTVIVAVRYWATFVDGKKVDEIDQFNRIDVINGVDYNAPVRKALGH